jgi:hypothetical protein
MVTEKSTHRDLPLSFTWTAPWKADSEQADDLLHLSRRQRDEATARDYLIGAAIEQARQDPEKWISYSRRKQWYLDHSDRGLYWPVAGMYSAITSAVDHLAADGWLEHRKVPPGNLGWQSSFRATPKLMAVNLTLMFAPVERIILRDADGDPIGYKETREIDRMRRRLELFNESARALQISLNGKIVREGEPIVIDGRVLVGAATSQLYRVFNLRFSWGGRFYGPWLQNTKKELRKSILINGCPVAEPDFEAHHARLLYDEVGLPLPPRPFDLADWERHVVKQAFYTMVNALTPSAARRAIAEQLSEADGDLRVQRAVSSSDLERAARLMEEIERKHPAIAPYLATGAGLKMMRKDSNITEAILARSARSEMPLVPIHDSYIVPEQHAERTKEIMDDELNKALNSNPSLNLIRFQKGPQNGREERESLEVASGFGSGLPSPGLSLGLPACFLVPFVPVSEVDWLGSPVGLAADLADSVCAAPSRPPVLELRHAA